MNAQKIRQLLQAQAHPEKVAHVQRFFKTGPGQYGEGDVFWGIPTPEIRAVVKQGRDVPLAEIEVLLEDAIHEVRACAVLLLVARFDKGDEAQRAEVIDLYVRRAQRINNWDLVDISCAIVGRWLEDKERSLLYRWADSANMWEQRIAVVSTLPLIKKGDFKDILALTEKLMGHKHDLMHKAMGWMLREVGKKDKAVLEGFLDKYVRLLARTTLRYAIERFPEDERKAWLRR